MGNKRTTQQPDIPEGAIIIAVDVVDVDSGAAEVALGEMLEHIGEERFSLAMDHLYQLFVWDVLTNEDSSLHEVFRQSMQKLHAHTMRHLHQSHERIEQLEAELRTLHDEHNDMKAKLTQLAGRVHVLESALCSARKCLKSDTVKQAVTFCQQLRKQRPGGETAVAALALADGVKDACICIREV